MSKVLGSFLGSLLSLSSVSIEASLRFSARWSRVTASAESSASPMPWSDASVASSAGSRGRPRRAAASHASA